METLNTPMQYQYLSSKLHLKGNGTLDEVCRIYDLGDGVQLHLVFTKKKKKSS